VSHGQGDVWHKAVTLGRQLDPSNPMFQDGSAAAAAPAPAAPRDVASVPPSPSPGRSPLHAAPAFNDGDISIAPDASQAKKSPADILAGAEDALARSSTSTPMAAAPQAGRLSAAETVGTAAAAGAALAASAPSFAQVANDLSTRVDTPAEPPRFDLDFHLDDVDRPAPLQPAAEPKPQPLVPAAPAQFGHPGGGLELDKLDLSFDPDRPAFEDPTPSVLDGQWHDAATKLDLAKAYQEMGDTDGAREILQEVLHEGDEQQKSEARGLLAKLAS
jgi:pilus assembly protein FimV